MDFKKLKVNENIINSLKKQDIIKPTKIQEVALPLVLSGRDVVAQSKTGSGKTLVFSIPIIQNMPVGNGVKALVIAPTRELASQIAEEMKKIARRDFFILKVYGGVSIVPQMRALSRTDVVIGTPGRLLDLIHRKELKLSKVKFLVLDEGDRMVDMGFIKDIDEIISKVPEDRQTMIFSATVPSGIKRLIDKYLHKPEYVKVEEHVSEKQLKQVYYSLAHNLKINVIVNLLKKEQGKKSLVFCSTKRMVDLLSDMMNANGLKADALHGNLSQKKREEVTKKFREGKINVLVATDVAARGLDIQGITRVYNFDSPNSIETYTHRIGRTARVGELGEAISLVSEKDSNAFRPIYFAFEKKLKEKKVTFDLKKPVLRGRKRKDSPKRNFTRKGFADSKRSKSFVKKSFSGSRIRSRREMRSY